MCASFKSLVIATFAVVLLFGTSSYAKDVFKGSDFLEWPENSQKTFMDAAILMAGGIAAINTDQQGQCIYNWYFNDRIESIRNKIRKTMTEHSKHPPSGVIIAMAQKECGSMRYK